MRLDDLDETLLEGISGYWHYHISRRGLAICGERRVMTTHAPRRTWGFKPTHMPTSYCGECDRLYRGNSTGRVA